MMFKNISYGLLLSILLAGSAQATCPPYTFTNGSTADATQINADFACLAPLASPTFTGAVGFTGTAGFTGSGGFTGSVGINNSAAPLASLDLAYGPGIKELIYGQGGTSGYQMGFGVNLGQAPNTLSIFMGGGSGANLDIVSPNQTLWPYTSFTSRLTVANTGNVGIGVTAPTYTLQVNGTAGGTSGWTTISDVRLKKNVEEVTDAVSLIKRLRAVRFDWRPVNEREIGKGLNLPTDEKQIGFIAQEVAVVIPEAVVVPKSGPSDMKVPNLAGGGTTSVKLSNDMYGLKEANLIPVLVEAVKEQQAEIESLKATVAALKSAK